MQPKVRPAWTCPRCRRRFANRNQWHSCATFSVRDHLDRAAPEVAAAYSRILKVARSFGPVTTDATKTAIQLRAGSAFAAVFMRKTSLLLAFAAPTRLPGNRFTRVTSHTPRLHEHYVRIRNPDDVDLEVESWLRTAYQREHQKVTGRRT